MIIIILKVENKVKQSEQNINSALYPKPQGDDANSYQLAPHKLIAF